MHELSQSPRPQHHSWINYHMKASVSSLGSHNRQWQDLDWRLGWPARDPVCGTLCLTASNLGRGHGLERSLLFSYILLFNPQEVSKTVTITSRFLWKEVTGFLRTPVFASSQEVLGLCACDSKFCLCHLTCHYTENCHTNCITLNFISPLFSLLLPGISTREQTACLSFLTKHQRSKLSQLISL